MKKRVRKKSIGLIVGIILILIILVGGVVFFILYSKGFFLAPVDGECKVLKENVGKDKVDFVFLTENVPQVRVNEYVDYFLESEPFVNSPEKFNFYYAGAGDCEIIKDKAVYCYSKELLRKSDVCPNDVVVVLSDVPKHFRSSAYMNVISINVHHNKNVILHEFAHIFANIADEYVPSTIPFGSKNCQGSCEGFEKFGELEGCYEGCSDAVHYRSSENSVMRTTRTSDFGKLNTILINEDLESYV
mgnify:CR=1 FL=1